MEPVTRTVPLSCRFTADVDHYAVTVPSGATQFTIAVDARKLSLLAPKINKTPPALYDMEEPLAQHQEPADEQERLRDRLAEIAPSHQYIITVRGHGFRLDNA